VFMHPKARRGTQLLLLRSPPRKRGSRVIRSCLTCGPGSPLSRGRTESGVPSWAWRSPARGAAP